MCYTATEARRKMAKQSKPQRIRLTDSIVRNTKPTEKNLLLWDSEAPGLHVRITPSGTRTWYFFFRHQGKQYHPKIQSASLLCVDEARKAARKWAVSIEAGELPKGEKARNGEISNVEQLAARYLKDYAEPKKAASSVEIDRGLLRKHILPALGSKGIKEVRLQDVQAFLNDVGEETPVASNRCRALLSKMFNLAEQWELRSGLANPVKGTEKYSEEGRNRYLSTDELKRWGKALQDARKPGKSDNTALDAVDLLLFTGCRKSEILSLRWDAVDLASRLIQLPKDKTRQQKGREVYLSSQAVAILKRLKPKGPFVFPSPTIAGESLQDIRGTVESLCTKAKVDNFTPHDLRRTFSTVGRSELGFSFEDVDCLTGHVNKSVSATYARLTQKRALELIQSLGDQLEMMLKGEVGK
jgi:integrase